MPLRHAATRWTRRSTRSYRTHPQGPRPLGAGCPLGPCLINLLCRWTSLRLQHPTLALLFASYMSHDVLPVSNRWATVRLVMLQVAHQDEFRLAPGSCFEVSCHLHWEQSVVLSMHNQHGL